MNVVRKPLRTFRHHALAGFTTGTEWPFRQLAAHRGAAHEGAAMKNRRNGLKVFPASAAERSSIRALKHWLLAAPGESPLQDQIVRLRIADAIARFAPGKLARKIPKPKRRMRSAAKA
jgi:hypothetical protein